MSRQFAELLSKENLITADQLKEVIQYSSENKKSHIRYLVEKNYITENKLVQFLSQKFGLPSVNISKFEINPDVIRMVNIDLVRKYGVIPIQFAKQTLVVAVCDSYSLSKIEELKFAVRVNVEPVVTTCSMFDAALAKYYGGASFVGAAIESFQKEKSTASELSDANIEVVQVHDIDSGSTEQDAPVIKLVNGILAEAVQRNASDIHVEAYERKSRVRLRIDGVLQEIVQIPLDMKRAVIARFKIMGRMDIAESRIPQDGRIKIKIAGKDVDFRVNTLPTLFGEKVVLRLLSKGNLQLDLVKLGFEAQQLEVFRKGINSPNGMVLVTGPTGSGKTTTLYSALIELNQSSDNLSTAEDPIEYNFEGINQTQVHKEIGLTFANVLRALLRQDPDTILVGEIRDYETAEVAIQAALTGHLVLSTLHTNDAVSTITRLMNMGVEPFLVSSAVNTIVAQRLLRTICSKCKEERPLPPEKLIELGVSKADASQMKSFKGKGCSQCNRTGYKGRVAIYEVFDVSTTIKSMVLSGATVLELKKQAVNEGMKTLRQSALSKVSEGRTTLEEALSLTMEE
jgi:type IV pilus assembly protein PilB